MSTYNSGDYCSGAEWQHQDFGIYSTYQACSFILLKILMDFLKSLGVVFLVVLLHCLHIKIEPKVQRFFTFPLSCLYIASSIINIPTISAFVTIDEPTLTHH